METILTWCKMDHQNFWMMEIVIKTITCRVTMQCFSEEILTATHMPCSWQKWPPKTRCWRRTAELEWCPTRFGYSYRREKSLRRTRRWPTMTWLHAMSSPRLSRWQIDPQGRSRFAFGKFENRFVRVEKLWLIRRTTRDRSGTTEPRRLTEWYLSYDEKLEFLNKSS